MEHSVLEQVIQALHASDQQIVQLLTLRSQLASQIHHASHDHASPTSLEERVATVVERLLPQNAGPLDDVRLTSIFTWVVQLTEPLYISAAAGNGAPKKG